MAHALTPPAHGDELQLARIHCQGMRELIESNPAHWEDDQALGVMRGLCKRAWAVMQDPVCRAYLAAIDDFAAALPCDSEHGWAPGRMFGPWFVRREVLRKLRMLADRLTELELGGGMPDQEVRRAMAARELHAGGGAALRRERYANVLRTAADAVGGVTRLARVLRTPQDEVERWVDGSEEAPLEVFLASLDLVAAGPFARETRDVRVAALPLEASLPSPQAAEQLPSKPARWAFDRAVVPTLLGAALIAAACLFASLPLRNALPLVAWLCIVAILLAWCARATRNAGTQVRTVGQAAVLVTICFLGASLVYRSEDQVPMPAPDPTPKTIDLPRFAPPAEITPEKPRRSATRPKVVHTALGPFATTSRASAGSTAPAQLDDACASLTGVASLQCLRCASEAGVWRLLCQEKARLEYCQRREGTEPLCPSVIPVSPAG
jgi:hypothetical protein